MYRRHRPVHPLLKLLFPFVPLYLLRGLFAGGRARRKKPLVHWRLLVVAVPLPLRHLLLNVKLRRQQEKKLKTTQ